MNRCLTEGRKAFLDRVAGIEAGGECERLAPLLSKLVDGEATADDLSTLRPHIRTCLSCRAALREYRSAPATAAALVPAAVLAAPGRPGFLDLPARVSEAIAGWAHKAHTATEMATAQKVAAVAASTAVIGGGAVITVERTNLRRENAAVKAEAAREKPKPPRPVLAAPAPPTPTPAQSAPAAPQLSAAERRAREAERKTPQAQQEFEPAWAAGEPTETEVTAVATTSATGTSSDSSPEPTHSGGGSEEFAP